MALVLKCLADGFREYFLDFEDANRHSFLQSPLPTLTIVITYLYFVKHLGPKLMRDRKPYQLGTVMLSYNVLQVAINLYVAIAGLYYSYWQPDYEYGCRDQMKSAIMQHKLKAVLDVLFVGRVLDLLDTVFLVLRKRPTTYLNVYHHCAVVVGEYLHNRFFAGSHYIALPIVNCSVHAIMYSYFAISVRNPGLKMSHIKRRITELQMVQFGVLILHFTWPLLRPEPCSLPKTFCFIAAMQNTFMMLLFADFYARTYGRKTPEK